MKRRDFTPLKNLSGKRRTRSHAVINNKEKKENFLRWAKGIDRMIAYRKNEESTT